MKKLNKIIITILVTVNIATLIFGNETKNNITKQGLYGANNLFTKFDHAEIVGGGTTFDLFYRLPLINKSSPLFQSTKLDIGIQEFLTPAFNRISTFIKIEPIAFFDVKIKIGHDYIFDFLHMESPNSDYSCEKIDDISKKTLHPKNGFRSDVIPTLKFAFKQIALLYTFTWTYHYYKHKGYYYDYNTFIIHKGSDSFFKHNVKFLFKVWDLRMGPQVAYSHVHSSRKNYLETSFLIAYFPTWKCLKDKVKPFLGASVGTYPKDRHRKGKLTYGFAIAVTYKIY